MVKITLFYNTGFSLSGNVPDSIDLLYTIEHKELENNYDMRQIEKMTVSVAITSKEAYDVDYIILDDGQTKYCYFVTGFTNSAAKTCNLDLMLDALTTTEALSGGSSAISGWVNRKTFTLKEAKDKKRASKSILNEQFVPMEEMITETYDVFTPELENNFYVQSTVDLTQVSNKAKTYTDNVSGSNVVVPLLPPTDRMTEINIYNYINEDIQFGSYKLPGLAIFDGSKKEILEAINDIRSLGMENSIQSSYIIPKEYVFEQTGSDGFINMLTGQTNKVYIEDDLDVSTVENAKAALLHTRIKLMSKCSNDEAEYSISQIGPDLAFKYWADPSPAGHPYCRPLEIEGNKNILYGAVSGAQWQNMPFVMSGSGNAVLNRELSRIMEEKGTDIIGDIWGSIGNVVSSGASGIGEEVMAGSIVESYNLFNSGKSHIRDLERFNERAILRSPDVHFLREHNMQNFIGNGFLIQVQKLSDNDRRRFDEYLHINGEATSEKWDGKWNRSNYDILKFDQIDFIHVDRPSRIHELAKTQLMSGVRVWHKPPTTSALKIGGNN